MVDKDLLSIQEVRALVRAAHQRGARRALVDGIDHRFEGQGKVAQQGGRVLHQAGDHHSADQRRPEPEAQAERRRIVRSTQPLRRQEA